MQARVAVKKQTKEKDKESEYSSVYFTLESKRKGKQNHSQRAKRMRQTREKIRVFFLAWPYEDQVLAWVVDLLRVFLHQAMRQVISSLLPVVKSK